MLWPAGCSWTGLELDLNEWLWTSWKFSGQVKMAWYTCFQPKFCETVSPRVVLLFTVWSGMPLVHFIGEKSLHWNDINVYSTLPHMPGARGCICIVHVNVNVCGSTTWVCECTSVPLSLSISLSPSLSFCRYTLNHTGDSSSPSIQGLEVGVGVGEGRSEVWIANLLPSVGVQAFAGPSLSTFMC